MKPVCLLLFAAATLAASPAAVLEVNRQGPLIVLKDVYLNHRGPFRMLVDTGCASSSVSQAVARRVGIGPTYAVEQATPARSRLVGATVLDEVRTGPVTRKGVEVLIVPQLRNVGGIDGVIGQSWLRQSDYLLDYRGGRLVIDPDPPVTGVKLPLRDSEGRPAVTASVGGSERELVLDSGADTLVLFGSAPLAAAATMFTANGPAAVRVDKARVAFGAEATRTMRAVHVNGDDRPGLLPLACFSAVYVSHRNRTVVLIR